MPCWNVWFHSVLVQLLVFGKQHWWLKSLASRHHVEDPPWVLYSWPGVGLGFGPVPTASLSLFFPLPLCLFKAIFCPPEFLVVQDKVPNRDGQLVVCSHAVLLSASWISSQICLSVSSYLQLYFPSIGSFLVYSVPFSCLWILYPTISFSAQIPARDCNLLVLIVI